MRKLLVAGATSGAGKTSVVLGLLAALQAQGKTIQPYKVGPDYVDTKFHTRITGRASRNLDNFLVPNSAALNYLFTKDTDAVDFGIVEGVMGLYDGLGTDKDAFSTASVAKQLSLPVILVIDAKSTSTSAAAVVKGFQLFDPAVQIAGVIINNVRSENHYQLVRGAIERYLDLPVLGCLPYNEQVALPSRQLGLVPDDELPNIDRKIEQLKQLISENVDLNRLMALAKPANQALADPYPIRQYPISIGIAKDEAFNFYYQDNLDLMVASGMTLVPFSPIHDQEVPEVDALYLGGGYPEEFAEALSLNVSMRQSIADFSLANKPIYAECGGLMYLGERLIVENKAYDMVGVFKGTSQMTPKLKKFGYCYAQPIKETVLGPANKTVVGHEFHHSTFTANGESAMPVLQLEKRRDGLVVDQWQGGYQVRQTFASYLHVHFYQSAAFHQYLFKKLGGGVHAL